MVIEIGDYDIDMEASLGAGNFGEVFKAHHRVTKEKVAAKRINTVKVEDKKYLHGEIAALKAASGHANVVNLLYDEWKGDILWLVTEYCEAGNIHEYLTAHTVTARQAALMVRDCVAGVHHLHHRAGVMHRDLKEENLLVTVIDGQPHVKVCDFGVSALIPDADDFRTSLCGTPLYFAPEMWLKKHERQYDKSIDIFALGLIIWSILHRKSLQGLEPPMDGDEPIGYSWMKNERGPDWAPLPFEVEDGVVAALVIHMVQFRPKNRLSIQMVKDIGDAFFEDFMKREQLADDHVKLTQLYEKKIRESCKFRVESEKLQSEKATMKADFEKVEEHNVELCKRIDDLTIENSKMSQLYDSERRKSHKVRVECDGLQKENGQMKRNFEALKEEKAKLHKRIDDLRIKNNTMNQVHDREIRKAKVECERFQTENIQMKIYLEKFEMEKIDLHMTIERLKIEIDKRVYQYDCEKQESCKIRVQCEKLQRENAEMKIHVEKVEAQMVENAIMNQLYETEKNESRKFKADCERQNAEMKTHVVKVEEKNVELSILIDELEKLNVHLRKRIDDMMIENSGLKSKLNNECQKYVETRTSLEQKNKAVTSQPVSVPIVKVPPNVKKVTSVETSGHRFAGFGDDCVIVESDSNLTKWAIEGETKTELCKKWSKLWPQEVKWSSKCVLDDGRIVFRSEHNPHTYIFTNDMDQKQGEYKGDFGRLRGAIGDKLVYCKEDKQGTYKFHLYNVKADVSSSHEFVCTLPMSVKSDDISLCNHPSGCFAVVDRKARTLDIYSDITHHMHRIQLSYAPEWCEAVTGVRDVIFVLAHNMLHVYSWAGEQLCEFSKQQLGVKDKWIHGVGSVGNRLLLTAGDIGDLGALYTYNVIAENAKMNQKTRIEELKAQKEDLYKRIDVEKKKTSLEQKENAASSQPVSVRAEQKPKMETLTTPLKQNHTTVPSQKEASSQPVSIQVVQVSPTVKKVTSMETSGNKFVGFGDDCVIVESDNNLTKWAIVGETKTELCKMWSKRRPNEVKDGSRKCVLDDGRVVFRREHNPHTYIFTNDVDQKVGQYEGDFGLLCGVIRDNLVYCKEDKQGTYKLHLYSVKPDVSSGHEFVCTLPMTVTSDDISVCNHPSGCFAVVDKESQTLVIYSDFTHHMHRVQLSYVPLRCDAVAAVRDVIVVLDIKRMLHVYNWAGEQLCEFSKQQLGFNEFFIHFIHGVGCVGNRLLVLTGGHLVNVKALYAYDVIIPNAEVSIESERLQRENGQHKKCVIS